MGLKIQMIVTCDFVGCDSSHEVFVDLNRVRRWFENGGATGLMNEPPKGWKPTGSTTCECPKHHAPQCLVT